MNKSALVMFCASVLLVGGTAQSQTTPPHPDPHPHPSLEARVETLEKQLRELKPPHVIVTVGKASGSSREGDGYGAGPAHADRVFSCPTGTVATGVTFGAQHNDIILSCSPITARAQP